MAKKVKRRVRTKGNNVLLKAIAFEGKRGGLSACINGGLHGIKKAIF